VKDRKEEDGRSQEGSDGKPGGLSRQGARAYQAAVEAVFSIPVAAGLGYWADSRFETEPVFLLAGLGLGFVTFVVRIVRMRGLVEAGSDESEQDG